MSRRSALERLRKACLLGAGAGSVAFAAILWWVLIPPESLAHASTAAALALLGLFILPASAFTTVLLERKRRRT